MYIDILWVHYNWREKRGSSDTLRGIVEVRENNTWERREGEREERKKGKAREGESEREREGKGKGEREREREREREGKAKGGKERMSCPSIECGKHMGWVHSIKGHTGN